MHPREGAGEREGEMGGGVGGLGADPDFTELLLWKRLSDEMKEMVKRGGSYKIQWGDEIYLINHRLIEDGRQNLLLGNEDGSIEIDRNVASARRDASASHRCQLI